MIRILTAAILIRQQQIWSEEHKFAPDKELVETLKKEFWILMDFKKDYDEKLTAKSEGSYYGKHVHAEQTQ